jgi:hypothetical protein
LKSRPVEAPPNFAPGEFVVFLVRRDTECADCGCELLRGSMIMLNKERKPLCLACADLDHLEYLPRGNTARGGDTAATVRPPWRFDLRRNFSARSKTCLFECRCNQIGKHEGLSEPFLCEKDKSFWLTNLCFMLGSATVVPNSPSCSDPQSALNL